MGLTDLFKKKPPKAQQQEQLDTAPPYSPPPKDTKIKILRNCQGSSNGTKIEWFREGQEYMVSRKLAAVLVEELKTATRIEG